MTEIVFLALANGQSVMGVIEQSSAQLPLSIHYPLMVQVDDAGEARFFPILAREYMKDAGGKPYIDLGVEWVYRVPPSQILLNAYQDATKRFY